MNTFTSSKVETFSSAAEAYPYKAHKAVIDIVSSLSSYIHIYWPIKPFSGLAIKGSLKTLGRAANHFTECQPYWLWGPCACSYGAEILHRHDFYVS